jgi:hypothetical protein
MVARKTEENPHSRIVQAAREALENSALFRGRSGQILMDEKEGTLLIQGRLPSFYLKQMLQTILGGVEGIKSIDNRVDVARP